jgi:hypothetical protein
MLVHGTVLFAVGPLVEIYEWLKKKYNKAKQVAKDQKVREMGGAISASVREMGESAIAQTNLGGGKKREKKKAEKKKREKKVEALEFGEDGELLPMVAEVSTPAQKRTRAQHLLVAAAKLMNDASFSAAFANTLASAGRRAETSGIGNVLVQQVCALRYFATSLLRYFALLGYSLNDSLTHDRCSYSNSL